MKGRAGLAVAGLALAGLGGFLGMISGVVPIKASSGHWAITAWFLETAMKRSVATHAMGIEAPPLEDEGLVQLGAAHFDIGCAFCHGAPGQRMPAVPAHMTPHPPRLAHPVQGYTPEQLFYLVKHGVKFTGMPAWPTQHRDDEVWAVVAFLRALPALEPADYDALVGVPSPAPTGAPEVVVERCAVCHGFDGLGRGHDAVPRIGGQRLAYVEASLEAYRSAERVSGIMQTVATPLSDDALAEAARYYASLPPGPPLVVDREAAERGARIARDEDGPRCAHCHGPKEGPRNPVYPDLAGQHPAYLRHQLELFEAGHRGGTPYHEIMEVVTSHALSPAEMRDVAEYYASLPADAPP